jgi:aspartyl-tRNA synthetase
MSKINNMYRTNTCGELNLSKTGTRVTLSGWVHRSRDLGGMTFIDLRDRYGITQLVFNMDTNAQLCQAARELGREFVIQVKGTVTERSNKNLKIPTGEIEISVEELRVLSRSATPPFTLEDKSDGGDDLRMKYRYLDLRREIVRKNLELRHRMAQETRKYLSSLNFMEIETPVLVNSTPEGARDFVVPSRMNPGEFYALPQSPQTLKQLLMVAGYDRYFQIVKCFRDEDLRADRQPEFTQIDCEMAFVDREDILETFAGLIRHLFREVKGVDFEMNIPRMTFSEAMERYGCDKPDIRFGMEISEITSLVKGKGFKVFDDAAYVGAICAPGCSEYSRKQTDELTAFIQRPQIGAKGLVYVKMGTDGIKSSVDKFYTPEDMQKWADITAAKTGDMIFVMAGAKKNTLNALNELRLEMGNRLGLRDKNVYKPLWVIDFPLLEWDEETKRFYAMHHPFTSPMDEDMEYFTTDPGKVRAKAYDMVINGVEVGGGSIRIHDSEVQKLMFKNLGMGEDEVKRKFSFIMDAFRYGAPPHGGIAFGFDRLVAMFAGLDSIRDVIAFPKNNSGKDVMLETPGPLAQEQLDELSLRVVKK